MFETDKKRNANGRKFRFIAIKNCCLNIHRKWTGN